MRREKSIYSSSSRKINDNDNKAKILLIMKVTGIPLIDRALGTIQKNMKKEWQNWRSKEELRLFRSQHYC